MQRIRRTVSVIDAHMARVLLPIVRIAIAQAARIDSAEGILREEQGAAEWRSQRQRDAVIRLAVQKITPNGKALVVGAGIDRITRGGSGQQVSDQAFVPTADVQFEIGRASCRE